MVGEDIGFNEAASEAGTAARRLGYRPGMFEGFELVELEIARRSQKRV